jgi:hypothetical protein
MNEDLIAQVMEAANDYRDNIVEVDMEGAIRLALAEAAVRALERVDHGAYCVVFAPCVHERALAERDAAKVALDG